MILHAKYAADSGATSVIVIHSPDTDVLVLLLHHYYTIGAKWVCMVSGRVTPHTDLRHCIAVNTLRQILSEDQMSTLMAMYCLTSCDTTSRILEMRRNGLLDC